MSNCCPENCEPSLLSNAPQERPALTCRDNSELAIPTHCLLPKFRLMFGHLACGSDYDRTSLALSQAELWTEGLMNAAIKEQALMFAAAHLLEVQSNSDLEQAQKLTAIAKGTPIKTAPVSPDFWNSTVYGQAYLSLVQSNPRLGILCI